MRKEREVGTISPGKYADIIAVRGDVLRYINLLQRVDIVVKRGTRYNQVSGVSTVPRFHTDLHWRHCYELATVEQLERWNTGTATSGTFGTSGTAGTSSYLLVVACPGQRVSIGFAGSAVICRSAQ